MRLFILVVLIILLGTLLYFNGELNRAERASVLEEEWERIEYEVFKMEEGGIWGRAPEARNIFIPKEHTYLPEGVEVGDELIVYFKAGSKRDGPVKIEKKQ